MVYWLDAHTYRSHQVQPVCFLDSVSSIPCYFNILWTSRLSFVELGTYNVADRHSAWLYPIIPPIIIVWPRTKAFLKISCNFIVEQCPCQKQNFHVMYEAGDIVEMVTLDDLRIHPECQVFRTYWLSRICRVRRIRLDQLITEIR